jgi:uncharacterized protein YbbC (DUF1343 family)
MPYTALFSHHKYITAKRIVLFCNQSSYDFSQNNYLFDILIEEGKLHRILMPEHGLFSEYQDQENIGNITYKNTPCISMYNKETETTGPEKWMFEDADILLIDVQDVGVRYFTYTSHMFALLMFVSKFLPDMPVMLIDRPNPIGSKTEGTIIDERYTSFLGPFGLIHRHGMSTGELCDWYIRQNQLQNHFYKIKYVPDLKQFISPSPNLPSPSALEVYPGQCFWEATTFSEGRGTTRPFELFGHPDISFKTSEQISQLFNKKYSGLAFLRPTFFMPVYHKHKDKTCCGWQIMIENPVKYHTLTGTLDIMRWVKSMATEIDFWRPGKYEFDSEATTAQLLIGDDDLIRYVNGEIDETQILDKLISAQNNWEQKKEYYR